MSRKLDLIDKCHKFVANGSSEPRPETSTKLDSIDRHRKLELGATTRNKTRNIHKARSDRQISQMRAGIHDQKRDQITSTKLDAIDRCRIWELGARTEARPETPTRIDFIVKCRKCGGCCKDMKFPGHDINTIITGLAFSGGACGHLDLPFGENARTSFGRY